MEEIQLPQIEQKESLKLSKMSKGFNWEIKIFPYSKELQPVPTKITDLEWIDRLEFLNNEMVKRFGGKDE